MFTNNPFAGIPASITPGVVEAYVIAMVVLVVAGTLFDVVHKRSAKYFFDNWRHASSRGSARIGGAAMASLAVRTLCSEVLASGEFCSARRRVAHLLTMYGFLAHVIASALLVFGYPGSGGAAPAVLAWAWHIGALMVCIGGYWFWFFIRADVVAEGNSPWRIVRADLFVLALLASATVGLVWSLLQSAGATVGTTLCFALYVVANTVLFGSVPWSKFAHMFFKPAAAFEKRVAEANGSRNGLPAPADRPEVFGSARRLPRNY